MSDACWRCNTVPDVRRVHTAVPGARPVDLALCDCDWARCPHLNCRKTLRGYRQGSHRCPHCDGRL